jgi:hypothetical protein
MPAGSGLRQDSALPPGLKAVEFFMVARSIDRGKKLHARVLVSILGFDRSGKTTGLETQMNRDLAGLKQVFEFSDDWSACRATIPVPEGAVYCVVHVSNAGTDSAGLVDNVHLFAR